MSVLKTWVMSAVKLFHAVKEENLDWQSQNQDQQNQLKQAKILADYELSAQLKKKAVQLEHDIALLKNQHTTELAMYKTKCQQDLQDYQQYLEALNQLKRTIKDSYQHLPEALAFTIHHHAKQLLDRMWEADDFTEKMRYEMQLIRLMAAIHEDARLQLAGESVSQLPENTLGLLKVDAFALE